MESTSTSLLDPEKAMPEHDNGPEDQSTGRRSTIYLDGLRGLAAFLVYMAHHIPWWYNMGNELEQGFGYHGAYYFGQLPFIRSFFSGGNAAVAIFFVLSGYVLSISPLRMLHSHEHREYNRGDYNNNNNDRRDCYRSLLSASVRRPLRLYIPPLGVSFIFAMIMQLPFGLAPHLDWPVPQPTLIGEIQHWFAESLEMVNPFRKHGVYEAWFPYDPPAWTMAVELQGSVLVFALIAMTVAVPARYKAGLFAGAGIVLLAAYQWAMACFVGGMILALNDLEGFDRIVLKRVSARTQAVIWHGVFFGAWFLLGQPGGPLDPEFSKGAWGWAWLTEIIPAVYYHGEFWRFFNAIAAVMLVYGVLRIGWLQRFLGSRVLLHLGRIAFSLYLIHIPFLWTMGDRLYRIFGVVRQDFTTIFDNRLPLPDYGPKGLSTGFWIAQVVILPMNLFLARLGTRFLDRPSVASGKWLVAKIGLAKNKRPTSTPSQEWYQPT